MLHTCPPETTTGAHICMDEEFNAAKHTAEHQSLTTWHNSTRPGGGGGVGCCCAGGVAHVQCILKPLLTPSFRSGSCFFPKCNNSLQHISSLPLRPVCLVPTCSPLLLFSFVTWCLNLAGLVCIALLFVILSLICIALLCFFKMLSYYCRCVLEK